MRSQLIDAPKSGENKRKSATYEEGFVTGMTMLLIVQDPFIQKVALKICTTTVAAASSIANTYLVTPVRGAIAEGVAWLTTRRLTPQEEEILRLRQELEAAKAAITSLRLESTSTSAES